MTDITRTCDCGCGEEIPIYGRRAYVDATHRKSQRAKVARRAATEAALEASRKAAIERANRPGRTLKPCGTAAAYQRHRLHHEVPCVACREATRIYGREKLEQRRARPPGTCAQCGNPTPIISKPGEEPMCRACRAKRRTLAAIPCPVCGTEFKPVLKEDGNYTQGCSYEHGMTVKWGPPETRATYHRHLSWNVRNAQRRENIITDPTPHTLAEIAERDGFRCQLCHEPVDMNLSGLHEQGPQRDHIIPLIVSWDDRRTNVQLAHRICNLQKGAALEDKGLVTIQAQGNRTLVRQP